MVGTIPGIGVHHGAGIGVLPGVGMIHGIGVHLMRGDHPGVGVLVGIVQDGTVLMELGALVATVR